MPPKRRGRNMRATEANSPATNAKKEKDEVDEEMEEEEGSLHWLTFQNGDCLSEDQIRVEFGDQWKVVEVDGAIGGPSDGWVMVGLSSEASLAAALPALRSRNHGALGRSLRPLKDGDGMMDPSATLLPKPIPATGASSEAPSRAIMAAAIDAGGGLQHFQAQQTKLLELASNNNVLLLEKMKEREEEAGKKAREAEEQAKRLQILVDTKEEQVRRLTARLDANNDLEEKIKKFFGENEDFHKKKAADLANANTELAAKLEDSEKRRMESLLADADSSAVREAVASLQQLAENVQSKTEQVWAVVSGLDPGTVVAGSGGGAAGTVSSTVGLLHNKVDKMVRLMVETSENQKKMNKVLQDLLKVGVVSKTEPNNVGGEGEENGERRKRRRERERSSERRDERSGSKRSRSPEVSEAVSTTTPIDHEFEEMKWGLNMALIGDGHWKSFNIVEDIQNIVSRMERKVNLRVMGREGETLSRMYDETRESLICALPTKCYKVAISVGTYDLKDNSLITLKEASMEEVRRRNEPKLQAKANILRDLVSKLINQGKSVVVMVPPHGEERIELHHHWEEVLLATLRDIRFPKLRVLNMAQVMRSTMAEFRNNDEYLDMWLAPTPKPRRYLSPYGTRRMFYALRQTVTAKSPQAAGMGNWAQGGAAGSTPASGGAPVMGPAAAPAPSPHLIPNPAEYPCPRCTRQGHTHDKCKSLDKLCRKCNNIGHFTEVHDITDPGFRQLIVSTLGINLWGDWQHPGAPDARMEEGGRGLGEKLVEMERRMGMQEGRKW